MPTTEIKKSAPNLERVISEQLVKVLKEVRAGGVQLHKGSIVSLQIDVARMFIRKGDAEPYAGKFNKDVIETIETKPVKLLRGLRLNGATHNRGKKCLISISVYKNTPGSFEVIK